MSEEIISDSTLSTSSTPIISDGNLKAWGMNVSISEIVGERIVDTWMSQISPEDMQLIYKAIEDELFSHDYQDHKFFKKTKTEESRWSSKEVDTPIWKMTQDVFATKYKDVIISKAEEIIASEEYQQKAQQVAQDIVDYAIEGYKIDLKNRIRERLVNNVVDAEPMYNVLPLRDIVRQEVEAAIQHIRIN